jgi:aspartyl-tRNA(Asn)/glutamyl-tRNA(Gln) amidotransferase subunit B
VRHCGSEGLGVKVEIKNINSFRFVEKALEYEIGRQIRVLESGRGIIQETRLWDPSTNTTESMRTKEEAHDYRYFPEPDLVPIMVGREWIEEIRESLPELPDRKRERFMSVYGLPEHDAVFLTTEAATAEWFESAVREGVNPKTVSNWMMGELMRILNEENRSIEECPLRPSQLAGVLRLVENGRISSKTAKTVFEEVYRTGKAAEEVVREKGLLQIRDSDVVEKAVDEVVARSPKEVERFRAGEEKLLGFFVGQVMKATKGKANPRLVNDLVKKKLGV